MKQRGAEPSPPLLLSWATCPYIGCSDREYMNLNEIRRVLDEREIQLTKSLGQNFLHDQAQLNRIVAAGDVQAGEKILEIGPGLGPLTQVLLQKHPATLLAIEKDRRLHQELVRRLGATPHLQVVLADALDYLRDQPQDWSEWKLIANLPYSVASPILVELAKLPGPPARMVVTLQLEVAQRLAAKAGDPDYGILTLLVQQRFEAKGMFKIPASCFFPAPNVDSACVTLTRRPVPLLEPGMYRPFEKLVKRGFSQRRKMMLKLLKADWPPPAMQQAFAQTAFRRKPVRKASPWSSLSR